MSFEHNIIFITLIYKLIIYIKNYYGSKEKREKQKEDGWKRKERRNYGIIKIK